MKLKFDLRLFDAGGAEAAQASADAQTEGLDTGSEQGAEETAQSTADRQAEYEAMLEKYADLDSKRMEQAARERVTRQMEAVREQAANEQVAIWKQEAEHIKTLYPDFDLMAGNSESAVCVAHFLQKSSHSTFLESGLRGLPCGGNPADGSQTSGKDRRIQYDTLDSCGCTPPEGSRRRRRGCRSTRKN